MLVPSVSPTKLYCQSLEGMGLISVVWISFLSNGEADKKFLGSVRESLKEKLNKVFFA